MQGLKIKIFYNTDHSRIQGIAISFPGNLLSNRMIELKIARSSFVNQKCIVCIRRILP